jgi:hypothetical protein
MLYRWVKVMAGVIRVDVRDFGNSGIDVFENLYAKGTISCCHLRRAFKSFAILVPAEAALENINRHSPANRMDVSLFTGASCDLHCRIMTKA